MRSANELHTIVYRSLYFETLNRIINFFSVLLLVNQTVKSICELFFFSLKKDFVVFYHGKTQSCRHFPGGEYKFVFQRVQRGFYRQMFLLLGASILFKKKLNATAKSSFFFQYFVHISLVHTKNQFVHVRVDIDSVRLFEFY